MLRDRQTNSNTLLNAERQKDKEAGEKRETERYRQTDRQTGRQTDRQTERGRKIKRGRRVKTDWDSEGMRQGEGGGGIFGENSWPKHSESCT